MTAHLYQDWIQQWDKELRAKGRKILLLQDNFSGHIVPDNLQNIRVENFEPNLTAHVQPNDQGIIRCFKAHYRARFIQRAVNRYDKGITPAEITTSISCKQCESQILLGNLLTQQPYETAGTKQESYPT
jgi:hypothetical protein